MPRWPTKTRQERFWDKVEIHASGCLVWTAAKSEDGYGKFWDGRLWLAHRWLWEQYEAAVPTGMQLDHLCRNPACVNLTHLEVVTPAENVLRGLAPAATRARHAQRTHCKHGHPFDEANTLAFHDGRRCRTCRADSQRERRQLERAAA